MTNAHTYGANPNNISSLSSKQKHETLVKVSQENPSTVAANTTQGISLKDSDVLSSSCSLRYRDDLQGAEKVREHIKMLIK